MHVLTLPRVLRRHDGQDPDGWRTITVPETESADVAVAATTQRVVRRVDGVGLFSVLKLALIFYGCVFASLAGGVLIVWGAISAMGYVDRFEHFMRSIGFRGFEVSTGGVVLGLIGVAGALTLLATLLTLVVAAAYNIVGSTGQGLVLKMSEPITRKQTAHAEAEVSTASSGDVLADVDADDDTAIASPADSGTQHAA
jgi:hypothetical protein